MLEKPRISILASIHNRLILARSGLEYLTRQTVEKDSFEVIFVDDGSTVDIEGMMALFKGQLRMQYISINHRKHPIYLEMNPDGHTDWWYHTPALSTNIGLRLARGSWILLTQPEIIQHPENVHLAAWLLAQSRNFFIGDVWHANSEFDTAMSVLPTWSDCDYDTLLTWPGAKAKKLTGPGRGLWPFLALFPREVALAIGGVNEDYQRGVFADDDEFRDRMEMAGSRVQFAENLRGIHQDHSYETEPHHRRDSVEWQRGAQVNRARYAAWRSTVYQSWKERGGALGAEMALASYAPCGDLSLVDKHTIMEL